MKNKATIIVLCALILSCRKDNKTQATLNGPLTNCQANTTCTYNYYENADFINFTNGGQPVSGSYRVFWYKSVNTSLCDLTTSLYFKTSLSDGCFDIMSDQINAGGLVRYLSDCPCCDVLADIHPIGGEIKGKKTGINNWLINATVVLGGANNKPIDTLVVNQYFTL